MKPPVPDHARVRSLPLRNWRAHRNDKGFVVIASLLILVVLTLIQLAMGRSFWLEEIMGGNTREKAHALSAAQSANSYAEWWLQQLSTNKTGLTCGTAGSITARVCTNAVSLNNQAPTATTTAFTTWTDFAASNSTYWQDSVISSSGAALKYYKRPGFYVQFMNGTADGSASYFKVTAFGYGGNSNAVAITQSLFQLDYTINAKGNKVTNLGGL